MLAESKISIAQEYLASNSRQMVKSYFGYTSRVRKDPGVLLDFQLQDQLLHGVANELRKLDEEEYTNFFRVIFEMQNDADGVSRMLDARDPSWPHPNLRFDDTVDNDE